MANRTSRHQRAGNKNLHGRKSQNFCFCCDDVINHKEKIMKGIHNKEIQTAMDEHECRQKKETLE